MSSMVSRRPEVAKDFGSSGWPMNHRNEAFWMSMRLGTSRTFSSFENVLRLRGAVVLAGKASPPAGLVGELRSVVPDQGATPKGSRGEPCPQRTGGRAAGGANFSSPQQCYLGSLYRDRPPRQGNCVRMVTRPRGSRLPASRPISGHRRAIANGAFVGAGVVMAVVFAGNIPNA